MLEPGSRSVVRPIIRASRERVQTRPEIVRYPGSNPGGSTTDFSSGRATLRMKGVEVVCSVFDIQLRFARWHVIAIWTTRWGSDWQCVRISCPGIESQTLEIIEGIERLAPRQAEKQVLIVNRPFTSSVRKPCICEAKVFLTGVKE